MPPTRARLEVRLPGVERFDGSRSTRHPLPSTKDGRPRELGTAWAGDSWSILPAEMLPDPPVDQEAAVALQRVGRIGTMQPRPGSHRVAIGSQMPSASFCHDIAAFDGVWRHPYWGGAATTNRWRRGDFPICVDRPLRPRHAMGRSDRGEHLRVAVTTLRDQQGRSIVPNVAAWQLPVLVVNKPVGDLGASGESSAAPTR